MLFSQSDSGLYLPRPSEWAYSCGIKILVAGDPRRDLVNQTFTNATVSSGSYSISPSVMGLAWSNTSASSVNSVGNIAPNASWTALIVANPVSQANRHAAIVQHGGVGAFQIGFNFNDQFTASAGRFAVTSLETGVNRSHAYVASAADGNPHAFLMRKSGTSISAWIDGVSKSVTSSGGFTGNPATATDSIKLYGTSTDSGNAFVGGSSIAAVAYFGQALSDGECARLSEHYSAVWSKLLRPDELFVWIPDASAAAALAGGATGLAAASGSLTTQIRVDAAAAVIETASGSLTTAIPLAGSAASVTVSSGVLTVSIRLSGDALSQALASASLSGGSAALAGGANAAASASGQMTTSISLSGSAVAQALATAGLTTSPAGLSGSAASSATVAGALSTTIAMVGQASALAIASGGLSTGIPLTGSAAAVSAATGNLTISTGLSAAAFAQAAVAGTLSTQIRLDAAAVAQALASAGLSTGGSADPFDDPRYTLRFAARNSTSTARARNWGVSIQ